MTNAASEFPAISFEQFREEWLQELEVDDLSPPEKGQRFAYKLITQWLNIDDDDENLVLCDGSGDGGIDVAFLREPESIENGGFVKSENIEGEMDPEPEEGNTWYVVQSKFGTAFSGEETIISEGLKIISTLSGEDKRLSYDTRQLLGKLTTFIEDASNRDRFSCNICNYRGNKRGGSQSFGLYSREGARAISWHLRCRRSFP